MAVAVLVNGYRLYSHVSQSAGMNKVSDMPCNGHILKSLHWIAQGSPVAQISKHR